MTAIAKFPYRTSALATTIPSHNHMIGPDLFAGEDLATNDACYIKADGTVMRAIAGQVNSAAAINDVQTLAIEGEPVAGEIIFAYGGVQATPAVYNPTAAQVQAALRTIPALNAVTVTGTDLTGPFTITGAGAQAGMPLDEIQVTATFTDANGGLDLESNAFITHTTVGQVAGTGVMGATGRCRGFVMQLTRRGEGVTLYDAVIVNGDVTGNLTPGTDYYLSGTVPGGLDTTATITGQAPIAFAMDSQRIYLMSVR